MISAMNVPILIYAIDSLIGFILFAHANIIIVIKLCVPIGTDIIVGLINGRSNNVSIAKILVIAYYNTS